MYYLTELLVLHPELQIAGLRNILLAEDYNYPTPRIILTL